MRNLVFGLIVLASTGVFAQTQQPLEKVGYVDISYVLSQLPDVKAMEEKMAEVKTKLGNDFTAKQQNYKTVFGDYSARYEQMNDSAKSLATAHINQLQAELQGFNGEAQRTLENTQKLYMAPIYLKIGRAIAEVAEENGYAILIPSVIDNNDFVMWGDPRVNLSKQLIEKMTAVPAAQATPEKNTPDKKKN